MERFNCIYPFTTENISGYMGDLDLRNKKIITVTGSADHVINSVAQGATEITTFDVNPLAKYYLDLKIAGIKKLSYQEFLDIFLYLREHLSSSMISSLDMSEESKDFWLKELSLVNDDWIKLRQSELFKPEWMNRDWILWYNLYLTEKRYEDVKDRLNEVSIKFINSNLKQLSLTEQFDYMFLSNISDYLNLMYNSNILENYKLLIDKFLENVKQIYFAYLYILGSVKPRSEIDKLDKVKEVFGDIKIETFGSALLDNHSDIEDGVLIIGGNKNVRK